ncbi:MAG TPA: sigma-54 dependent transcriptional regulator [Bacteroidales bacterium]|nr:sigma-54 dependent transcriptional regulator [Bacteroidales bacterium]
MIKKRILIIDDDFDICTVLSRFLNNKGYEADSAFTASGGLTKFRDGNYDLVITDYRLGEKSGKDVLVEIKKMKPETIVIVITGYSHIKTAVDVVKAGAYDYISKPLIPDEVLNLLSSAFASTAPPPAVVAEEPPVIKPGKLPVGQVIDNFLVGCSKVAQQLYSQVDMVAPTNYSVILYGETGTGKEVIAKRIHKSSTRANQPFVAIDCGALSKELAGSALFGHVKGAFTGALSDKEGHFEAANHGTIFLDEVANLSYETQAILLRVIQERKCKKVGGTKEIDLDVRVIVASNESLFDASRNGKFREDLYHRFNEFTLHIPPLRQRLEDIPLFAEYFLDKSNKELNKTIAGFDNEVMNIFLKYPWPGNLREMRNVVRRAVLLTKGDKVGISTLPHEIINPLDSINENADIVPEQDGTRSEFDLKDAASKAEYETIMKVLRDVKFNKSKAAKILKVDRKTLYNKIKTFEESNRAT